MSDPASPCRQLAGLFVPVVNRNRCEGRQDCVRVCPYQGFEIRTLTAAHQGALPFIARMKALAHGNRQAFANHPDSCHGCGRCVAACPEAAITLTRHPAAA